MRFSPFATVAITLSLTTTLIAADPSPFADKPVTSYSGGIGLTWGQAPLTDFGPRTVTFQADGIRTLNQVPPPGVHPRIYFTPDDLPDLRRRLKETRCGQAAWNNLLCWTEMMKGRYDDTADYAKRDVWKGGFGGLHGPVPLYRLGVPRSKGAAYNRHPAAAELYQKLVSGTATECPVYYWNVFSLEAFRCLIQNDESGARDLASAVITAMKIDQTERTARRTLKKITTPIDQPVGGFQLAFVYDFLYNYLTPAQRDAIHAELANTTWNHDNYGTFNEASASRSNWATFSYWLFQVLAIEGEEGFNDLKVRGMYRGWRNLMTYGWFASGATFEGEAKNQLGMDGILTFARREKLYGFENLCGHPHLRAYATRFLPLSVIPTQDGFVKYDLLGGVHGRPMGPDSLGLKFMFPNDNVIDWVYRQAVGNTYENVPDRPDGYRNDLLFFLIFASDFDPSNNDPGQLNLGNTFFCGERALLMTRSGWDKNALMLNLHTRQANGGHAFADRNAIMLAGAGRVWSPTTYASFQTQENSVVCIDGKTQKLEVPGRMVDFIDTPLATFATGDATYCWDWNWRILNGKKQPYTRADLSAGRIEIPAGWEQEHHTVNDFAFTKLSFDYLDRPMFELPHWIAPAGSLNPVVRQPNYPVQKAFRTAGIVRGQHPYALVVDDIQKDDAVHHYDWILVLEKDVQISQTNRMDDRQVDILLTAFADQADSKNPLPAISTRQPEPGQPMLLVRVLNRSSGLSPAPTPTIDQLPNATNPRKYTPVRRLLVSTDAVAPDFKIILYPHRQGAPLPTTTWDAPRTSVTVEFPGQKDVIRFDPAASGKTKLTVSRDGEKPVVLAREVEPLK